jgi:hypothetical protein
MRKKGLTKTVTAESLGELKHNHVFLSQHALELVACLLALAQHSRDGRYHPNYCSLQKPMQSGLGINGPQHKGMQDLMYGHLESEILDHYRNCVLKRLCCHRLCRFGKMVACAFVSLC